MVISYEITIFPVVSCVWVVVFATDTGITQVVKSFELTGDAGSGTKVLTVARSCNL